jgi:primosomal protein N' (replication factor Y) (superfamily II helicase)
MLFADVILPLAVERNYTFGIPIELHEKVKVGCRVEVQFGKRKIYSGIVKTIHSHKPDLYEVKPIRNLLDDEPIVTPTQLKFWEWMASYYCCTEGDVMNASLPAHLKLVSDTYVVINEGVDLSEHELTDDEFMVMQALEITQNRKLAMETSNDSEV